MSVCLQGVGPRHRGGRGHHNLVHTASAVGGERAEADRRSVRREVLEGVRSRVCDGTADGPLGATRSVLQNSAQRESGRVVHAEQLEGVAEGDAEAGSAAPRKILVERYLMEIARAYNVDFEPDPTVMAIEDAKIDFNMIGGITGPEETRPGAVWMMPPGFDPGNPLNPLPHVCLAYSDIFSYILHF